MNTAQLKYFDGTSDDLEDLEGHVRKWLEEQGPAQVHFNSAVHFDVSEKVWHILVTALYQRQPQSSLVIPRAHIPGSPSMN